MRRWALVLALAAILAGCDIVGVSTDVAGGVPLGLTCEGLDQATCADMARSMGWQNDAAIVGVRVSCARLPCTERSGQATVRALRADGTVTEMSAGWSGAGGGVGGVPPDPMPPEPVPAAPWDPGVVPACLGFAEDGACERQIEEARSLPVAAGRTVVAVRIRCTTACTASSGTGRTELDLDDGTTQEHDWAYAAGG